MLVSILFNSNMFFIDRCRSIGESQPYCLTRLCTCSPYKMHATREFSRCCMWELATQTIISELRYVMRHWGKVENREVGYSALCGGW